eukprot:1192912-Prorocentrum_minimum.AAC.5
MLLESRDRAASPRFEIRSWFEISVNLLLSGSGEGVRCVFSRLTVHLYAVRLRLSLSQFKIIRLRERDGVEPRKDELLSARRHNGHPLLSQRGGG